MYGTSNLKIINYYFKAFNTQLQCHVPLTVDYSLIREVCTILFSSNCVFLLCVLFVICLAVRP